MNVFSRQIYPNPEEVMWAAAEKIERLAVQALEKKGRVTLALSGGNTPRALYQLLADPRHGFRDRLPWQQMHFFWSDERYVPADDDQSNYKMARETLFAPAGVPPENVHRFRTELASPESTAEDYQEQLEKFFGTGREQPPPRFDIMLLGMGADGHTASLFPGLPLLHASEHWVKAFWVPQLRSHRISLLPDLINESENILLLVTGAEKAEAVAMVLTDEPRNAALPVQKIQPTEGNLLWLLDQAAASLVLRETA